MDHSNAYRYALWLCSRGSASKVRSRKIAAAEAGGFLVVWYGDIWRLIPGFWESINLVDIYGLKHRAQRKEEQEYEELGSIVFRNFGQALCFCERKGHIQTFLRPAGCSSVSLSSRSCDLVLLFVPWDEFDSSQTRSMIYLMVLTLRLVHQV